MRIAILFVCLYLSQVSVAFSGPKYGPKVQPLSAKTNNQYFRNNDAPDYWALSPYYIPQETPRGCSAGNLTMLLNAVRDAKTLQSDQELVTYKSFIESFTDAPYKAAITGATKTTGENFSNKNLTRLFAEAVKKLTKGAAATKVEFFEVDQKNIEKSRAAFIKALKENEKSSNDFIFFSFVQGAVTGDPEGGAHVATVAAYDNKTGLVLVLDPDRQWYEPYWVSANDLFDSIRDPKSDSRKEAGWIYIKK